MGTSGPVLGRSLLLENEGNLKKNEKTAGLFGGTGSGKRFDIFSEQFSFFTIFYSPDIAVTSSLQ